MNLFVKLLSKVLDPNHSTDETVAHILSYGEDIRSSVVALAQRPENLDELHTFTHSFFMFMAGGDVSSRKKESLRSLDVYVKLMLDKRNGKEVDEQGLNQLRKELLSKESEKETYENR